MKTLKNKNLIRMMRYVRALACGLGLSLSFSITSSAAVVCIGPPVPVTVVATSSAIAEAGTATAQFVFTLGGAVGDDTHLTLQISGTAANGVDYQTLPTQVTIPANQTQASLTVTPITDMVVEGTETLTVRITASDNVCVSIGSTDNATISIVEGDSSLATALDDPNLVWITGGNAAWSGLSPTTHDGVDAAQSGFISDSQESWVQTSVNGPGLLTFWWKVSSETDFDWLRFHIDGILQQQISGEVDWQQRSFPLPPGSHTLKWRYVKDSTGVGGQDRAWVDQVSFTLASGAPVIVTQPASQIAWPGAKVTLNAVALGAPPLTQQWFFNVTNAIADATNAALVLNNTTPSQTGQYRFVASNASGSATSSLATVTVTNNGPVSQVLLFSDSLVASPFEPALTNLGLTFVRYSAESAFNSAVNAANRASTLVVVDAPQAVYAFSSLASFVSGGGRLVIQAYSLVASPSLAASFQVAIESRSSTPLPLYDWGGSPLFVGLSSPVNFIEIALGEDAQKLHPLADARPVAGFVNGSMSGEAAVVIGNGGRTIVNGFYVEGASSGTNAIRLAQSEISFLIGTAFSPPVFLSQPQDRLAASGATATFGVAVVGGLPLTYQWRRNGTNLVNGGRISGALSPVLSLTNVIESDSGIYSAFISNAFGTATSSNATLLVSTLDHFSWSLVPSPRIKDAPFAVTIEARDASNRVVTNFQNAVMLSASTGEVSTNSILPSPIHQVVNGSGNWTDGYSFTPNTNITVTAVRHYFGTKVSIWTDAGVLLAAQPVSSVPGAWVETPLAAPIPLTAGTRYRVAVFTGGGNWYYRTDLAPTFPNGTIDQSWEASGDAFPVNASGAAWWFVDLRYAVGASGPVPMAPTVSGNFTDGVWTGNVTVLSSATNAVLLADNLAARTGRSNPFDVVPSNQPPIIVAQPTARSVRPGTNVNFSVSVFGPPPLTYQWRVNGTNLTDGGRIGGAVGSILTISNCTQSDAGLYSVLVSNAFGTATSSNAALAVSQLDHFTWLPIASPQDTNLPFTVTIQARDSLGQIVSNFTGTVALSGAAPIVPGSSGTFSNGIWSGTIRVSTPVTSMVVTADDGAGHIGASNPFQVVNPNQPPTIVTQPASQTVHTLTNLSLSVSVMGSLPLTYQWQRDGGNLSNGGRISGATSSTLTISNIVESDRAIYTVLVSNPFGSATSWSAYVTVKALDHFVWLPVPSPVSTLLPLAVTVEARDFSNRVVTNFIGTVALSAAVASTGTPVSVSPGASGAFVAGIWRGNLSIAQVVSNVVLRADDGGGAVGLSAPFDTAQLAAFTIQPTNQTVLPGTNVTLVASAVGTGPVRYQWRFEGTNILDATNSSYTFFNANLTDHHGNFSVLATDNVSFTASSNAFIYVLVKPGIVQHITAQTVLQGANATFSLVATGAPPLWYRWIRNGAGYATTSVPVLVITNVQASALIRVAVTNFANFAGAPSPGPTTGNSVQLTMLPDADHDGLPDAWELLYFGNATAAVAGADSDGDGMSNRDEYLAGTNPTNALSVLKLVLTATNANVLEFVAQTNLGYAVLYRTNLSSAFWSTLTNITAQSLVRTVRVNTVNSPQGKESYYRVVIPPVP